MDVDMVKVKICGVTTVEDALMAANAGADMLGLNFYKKSPRYLTLEAAREMAEALRATLGAACPLLVGVFVNELVSTVSVTMEKVGLNFAQLSGDESGELLRELHGIAFKAIRPRSEAEAIDDTGYFMPYLNKHDARIPTLLIDAYQAGAYGGTGEQANYAVASAVKAQVPRLMLAGGLNPDNVAEAVRVVQPWGVDVASGVEIDGQAGRKDETKVQAFISAAKSASA